LGPKLSNISTRQPPLVRCCWNLVCGVLYDRESGLVVKIPFRSHPRWPTRSYCAQNWNVYLISHAAQPPPPKVHHRLTLKDTLRHFAHPSPIFRVKSPKSAGLDYRSQSIWGKTKQHIESLKYALSKIVYDKRAGKIGRIVKKISRGFFDFAQCWYTVWPHDSRYTTNVQGKGVKDQGHSVT